MWQRLLTSGSLVMIFLAACGSPSPAPTATADEPNTFLPSVISGNETYPEPQPGDQPVSSHNPYLAPPSGFEPQADDNVLARGKAFVEIADSNLRIMESYPIQVSVQLKGNLPTPCNQLRVIVNQPDPQNRINLEVYSVVEKGKICTDVLEPFTVAIPIGSFTDGSYSVWVNGEKLDEFDAG